MERPLYISATQLVTVYVCNGVASQFRSCTCRPRASRRVNAEPHKEPLSRPRRSCSAARIRVHVCTHACTVAREYVNAAWQRGSSPFARSLARRLCGTETCRVPFTRRSATLFRSNETTDDRNARSTKPRNCVVPRIYRGSSVITRREHRARAPTRSVSDSNRPNATLLSFEEFH